MKADAQLMSLNTFVSIKIMKKKKITLIHSYTITLGIKCEELVTFPKPKEYI